MMPAVQRPLLLWAALVAACATAFPSGGPHVGDGLRNDGEVIFGPSSPANRTAWLAGVHEWRKTTLAQIRFNGSIYDVPELLWTRRSSWIQTQMHPFDLWFYNTEDGYTIDSYLDRLEAQYGGIDSVLVWPTYPNIGIDNRNQFDLIESLPGGRLGLIKITARLHARGVRVLWPYNPWDTGSRRTGEPDVEALDALVVSSGADGFNGDTMPSIPLPFYLQSVVFGHPLALEPEGGGSAESANWATLGWGYWPYPYVPAVDRWKWLTPQRLTHVCDRWAHNRSNDLQAAHFNGDGFVAWQNVWGTYNGMTGRDSEAVRRLGRMWRFFGSRGFLESQEWVPHVLTGLASVFGSRFARPSTQELLFHFVNRDDAHLGGAALTVDTDGAAVPAGARYFDCYHGLEVVPRPNPLGAGPPVVVLDMEALGFGCLLVTPNASTGPLLAFLQGMRGITARPLSAYDSAWQFLPQTMVGHPETERVDAAPAGMVEVPAGPFTFEASGVEIEGGPGSGVDFQFPWEEHPQRAHSRLLSVGRFFLDKYPVTNEAYRLYLQASGYRPRDPHNWLRDWANNTYPAGWARKPVTWVSIKEARQFCWHYGKRLPSAIEWQYAGQNRTGNLFPWGPKDDPARRPKTCSGTTMPGPDDVDAHPAGASPFGVEDMVGNVWQYTDEFRDEHTRAALLRGGSYYRPTGSRWYFPQALELNTYNKYLLMDDSYERAGALGFRCAQDAVQHNHSGGCAGPVCGRVASPDAVVDLAGEGTADWVHFGYTAAGLVDSKATAAPVLSRRLPCNATPSVYSNNPVRFSWEAGTPSPAVTATPTGIYLAPPLAGFGITVPGRAGAGGVRTIRIYVGVYKARGQLRATQDDVQVYLNSQDVRSSAGTMDAVFTITIANGRAVDIAWTLAAAPAEGDGNITFQAVTLADSSD